MISSFTCDTKREQPQKSKEDAEKRNRTHWFDVEGCPDTPGDSQIQSLGELDVTSMLFPLTMQKIPTANEPNLQALFSDNTDIDKESVQLFL